MIESNGNKEEHGHGVVSVVTCDFDSVKIARDLLY